MRLLEEARPLVELRLAVFLLDDNSPDQTGSRIVAEMQAVTLIAGTGDLFWNRGMHAAAEAAKAVGGFDAYLLFNDDVQVLPGRLAAFVREYDTLQNTSAGAILVGAICDEDGKVLYSGMVRRSRWNPLKLSKIPPNGQLQICDSGNGNFVMIPSKTFHRLGNLDPKYRHGIGDIDILIRARSMGANVFLHPLYIGKGHMNRMFTAEELSKRSLRQRFLLLFGPKRDPLGYLYFLYGQAGLIGVGFFLVMMFESVVGALLPSLLAWLRRGRGQWRRRREVHEASS